jgi:hypothetical protein
MLTLREIEFIEWYRSLCTSERLAVWCFIKHGDNRLILLFQKRGKRFGGFRSALFSQA